jgi:hypothetical protein
MKRNEIRNIMGCDYRLVSCDIDDDDDDEVRRYEIGIDDKKASCCDVM